MNDDSDKGGAVIAIGLVVLLLLIMGGAGIYFVVGRERVALAHAEEARLAEAQARMRAEQARAVVNVVGESATAAGDKKMSFDEDSISAEITSILLAQQEAWNRADLDAFMEHYWKSEALTFSSTGKTTRGWTETLDRYRERYPTPETMGRVTFTQLEITALGDSAALVLGQWRLERESEPLAGNFSLVLRKIDDRWLIVHDHTSRLMD
jgi:beta-aspartyl-peptidase (threonine type)